MRTFLLPSAVLIVCASALPTTGLAARTGAGAAAQQAIIECRQTYGGYRGKAVEQAKPIYVERCFKQKTGYYPFQLGIPLYPPGYDWYLNPDRY